MKITKIGHCCLLVEDTGVVVMTDPGAWSTGQNEVTGVDVVVITHEHADHFHLDSLKQVLKNNPNAVVVTNSAVGALLDAEGISATLLEDGQRKIFAAMELAAFGSEHAVIHRDIPLVVNTGYLFQNRFFYPGDAFTDPGVDIEILAVPMIGPWMKMEEALDWAVQLSPEVCFPVHDGMLTPRPWIYGTPTKVLGSAGIKFDAIEPGEGREY